MNTPAQELVGARADDPQGVHLCRRVGYTTYGPGMAADDWESPERTFPLRPMWRAGRSLI